MRYIAGKLGKLGLVRSKVEPFGYQLSSHPTRGCFHSTLLAVFSLNLNITPILHHPPN